MIHEHHQWLEDVNRSIVESYTRDQKMAGSQGASSRQDIGSNRVAGSGSQRGSDVSSYLSRRWRSRT